ncbi:FIST C-terminal domain-containing protein [Alteromonas ponticola]|uniref:FIST C-terminal domain-containing protein n=1 Tax=Alteromonas aquimaris TaxID=2998417 RepID=A0ABT3P331_9ALTE|nr:FIST N-terminal domain-containing protein [Alteromonas aquimaris]MCW8107156.1 FIST C-terminal domain-containing protein [Alteromonas aquimaris]
MTEVAVVHTNETDSALAGKKLGSEVREKISGNPDALIVFASPLYDFKLLLRNIAVQCNPTHMLGCSSAGEFSSAIPYEGSACVLALKSSDMAFSVGVARNLSSDRKQAAQSITASFMGLDDQTYNYRTAMVLTDALAGFADSLIEEITLSTSGMYQLFGGGAGDDAQFKRTHIFYGEEAITNAAVALEILSNKPIGIGVQHGWEAASAPMRVTEADGKRLISVNAVPAIEAFQAHAEATGQILDLENPMAFFLSNVIGIQDQGAYRLRVPLTTNAEGEVFCAAEIPSGSIISIMRTSSMCSAEAAAQATKTALAQLEDHRPKTAIFFDCVATRLRTGQDFGLELGKLDDLLSPASYVGCNTYGQIARAEGQFGGFHNCTAVIGIFPE